jgi:hypothetical protein
MSSTLSERPVQIVDRRQGDGDAEGTGWMRHGFWRG